MGKSYKDYAQYMKALSDETRLKIFLMLTDGELCACNILEEFNITQPTLSYHMKTLCESGLVKGRKDGIWMKYSINEEALAAIKGLFNSIEVKSIDCSECCTEC
ncbi:MAG: winged helix-turn-helix transcriptional regulator [Clostridiales bacterium]|nr:winged helix-turn-helix transcriptional regulator [Clostridiales bacterium]NLM43641.1 winged helix-turn-helix transcriptional regulator [Clostridiales bacterium]